MNQTEKQRAFDYSMYVMLSSYFDKTVCTTKLQEKKLCLAYQELKEDAKQDYETRDISSHEAARGEDGGAGGAATQKLGALPEAAAVPELGVVRARAVWLEIVKGVRGNASALMERLDALTDPERVEDANMLARWKAKYENEITARMKSRWWRRMARKRDVG